MKLIQNKRDWLTLCSAMSTADVIYADTETTGLDPYTCRLLILSLRLNKETYVVDFTSIPVDYLTFARASFENPSIVKVFHNAVFDFKFLYHHGGIQTANIHCTMVTEQLLKAGLQGISYSLAATTMRRLESSLDKSVRDGFIGREDWDSLTQEEFEYAALDVDVLEPIREQQLLEIKEEELDRVYDLEMKVLPITAMMEYTGIDVDVEKMTEAIPVFQNLLRSADRSIQDAAINSGLATELVFSRDGYIAVNTGSQPQMKSLMNAMDIDVKTLSVKELSDWDYRWQQRQKKNTYVPDELSMTMGEEENEINIGYQHPFLRQHGIRTGVEKILNTYLVGLVEKINPITHRIHPGFKQCGATATGRYSSTSPNFQNLPNTGKLKNLGLQAYDIRSMFVSGPEHQFIIADYSAIELVILAALSQDETLIEQILVGDVHSYVGNKIFGTNFTKDMADEEPYKTLRHTAKTLTYAICYGTGGRNLYRTLSNPLAVAGVHMKPEDGDAWIAIWKETFPKTGKLLDFNGQSAVNNQFTKSVLGRRRHWDYYEIHKDKWSIYRAMREGTNAVIQSSSADMTKLSLFLLAPKLDPREAQIVATVHDEDIVRVRNEMVAKYVPVVKWAMEEAGRILFPDLPEGMIRVSPKTSTRYDK